MISWGSWEVSRLLVTGKGDLSASKSVEESINKSRCAFFHFGSIGGISVLCHRVGILCAAHSFVWIGELDSDRQHGEEIRGLPGRVSEKDAKVA